MSDDEEVFRRQCADCGVWSPPTRSQHTLISARLGWRLRREIKPDGDVIVEWRCPACYAKRRASGTSTSGEFAAVAPPSSGRGEK